MLHIIIDVTFTFCWCYMKKWYDWVMLIVNVVTFVVDLFKKKEAEEADGEKQNEAIRNA